MSRERKVEAFILKRQDYAEADQIITLFSKEEGKLRALVKAAKLPTSRLQPVLQPLFETRVTLTGSSAGAGLAKVIGAQLIKVYSGILENESKLGAWYMASELIIRSLPDSAPNEQLFDELELYATFLHETDLDPVQTKHSMTQFQIKCLSALGLGLRIIPPTSSLETNMQSVWFSMDRGGFATTDDATDSIPVSAQTYQAFLDLRASHYKRVGEVEESFARPLYNIVNRFVTYQLEREIKSQQYLANT